MKQVSLMGKESTTEASSGPSIGTPPRAPPAAPVPVQRGRFGETLLGTLGGRKRLTREPKRGMSRRSTEGSAIDVIERDYLGNLDRDKAACLKAETEWRDARAERSLTRVEEKPTAWFADKLYSTSDMEVISWRPVPWALRRRNEEGEVEQTPVDPRRLPTIPDKWGACGIRVVLWDIDRPDAVPETVEQIARLEARLEALVRCRPQFSGSYVAMNTSKRGMQFVFELAGDPKDPETFFGNPAVSAWYDAVSAYLLKCLAEIGCGGGTADRSAFAAGRYGRRPGWRLQKDGEAYCAMPIIIVRKEGV